MTSIIRVTSCLTHTTHHYLTNEMELHLSWKKVSLIFPPPFLTWMDFFLYSHGIHTKDTLPYFLYHLLSIISQVEAIMDYAFKFSSTFSTHQNKHKASDWFIDWDQVKISELRWRKAAGFRSVRQGNQIICSSVGPASPVGFSHHFFSCTGDQCQIGSSILKMIFPVAPTAHCIFY